MSVEKKGGKWYIRGKVKLFDDSVVYYHRLARGCTLKKEAEEYERKFRKQYQDIQVSSEYLTFEDAAHEFLSSLNNVKKSTYIAYSEKCDKICQVFGSKRINLLNKNILQKYIRQLESEFSKETVAKYYYFLKRVFDYCIQNEYLITNPMNKVIRNLRVEELKKDMNFWEPSEFQTFIDLIDNKEQRSLFIFLYWMGVRKGEACALQWKDIDFNTNTVQIYKSVSYKSKGIAWEITTPKTSNSNRNITMFDVVRKALLDWKSECSKMYKFSDECFVWGYYKPLSDNTPRRWKDKYIQIAHDRGINLKNIRIHDFRHSHASYLINNMGKFDFTDFDIAKRLGHTVEMLHQTYAHQFKGMDKRIIEQIQNNTSQIQTPVKQSEIKPYEELKEIKELYDMGILTDEEYTAKKKQLLGI